MKRVLYLLVLCVLMAFDLILIFNYRIVKSNSILLKHENIANTVEIENLNNKISFYNKLINRNLNTLFVSDFLNQELKSRNGELYKLNDLISDQVLFFLYSEHTCSPCVEQEIQIINEFSSKDCEIIIIANYTNARKFESFIKLNKPTVKIYTGNNFDFLGLHNLVSYYFVLNKAEMKVCDFYFPDKYSEKKSRQYLNKVMGKEL